MAKIMVVEDEKTVLDVTAELLEVLGHQCLQAENGGEARQIIEKESGIDLVLLDRSLPDGDGLLLADAMVAAGLRAPIILCSGDLTVLRQKMENITDCLAKPYSLAELQTVLERHLAS